MLPAGSVPPTSFDPESHLSADGYTAPAIDAAKQQQAALESVTVAERPAGRRTRTFAQAPATYLLLGINIAVYLWMLHKGVDRLTPSPEDLIRFGANNAEAVLLGHQWWRVVTAMFVHVGLVHLATNMWCLWNLGLIGEPLLGLFGMCSVYLLTGVAGNLLSIAANVIQRQYGEVGAGASGAVFGLAGILIVLFSNKRLAQPRPGFVGIPLRELHAIRRSVISFAALNLLIGAGTMVRPLMQGIGLGELRIDNMAHLGGFSSGLLLGIPLLARMTTGRVRYLQRQRLTFGAAALVLALFAVFVRALR
ncbi:MAG: rhomboid family intramembrane serine protease [Janthinobacterium lividum]